MGPNLVRPALIPHVRYRHPTATVAAIRTAVAVSLVSAHELSVPLRRETANHHMLRWLKTVVVSEVENAHEMRQVGIGRRCAVVVSGIAGDVSLLKYGGIKTGSQ